MSAAILVIGIIALALGAYLFWKSRRAMSPEEASRIVKELAEEQKVEVKLTVEQMEAIRAQWLKDPSKPAQITFTVDERPVGDMRVATCPYFGDTCCA